MSRIVAVDFGLKKTGIAVTDEFRLIASPLTTVKTESLLEFLINFCKDENVGLILIGQPKRWDNSFSDIEVNIQEFVNVLMAKIPDIEIKRVDERFTSKLAFQSIIASGVGKKKRRNKEMVDQISATIILQDFLASKNS
ncbi:MAG TPA: Holliday junction resolvase RuvX [Flavobacteriaceae bacterium]|nr:Holliday junction resolvase RuvX [Flavobacteriaceae bacterium]